MRNSPIILSNNVIFVILSSISLKYDCMYKIYFMASSCHTEHWILSRLVPNTWDQEYIPATFHFFLISCWALQKHLQLNTDQRQQQQNKWQGELLFVPFKFFYHCCSLETRVYICLLESLMFTGKSAQCSNPKH